MKFTGKQDLTVGIDIGTYSVKVISLERKGADRILNAYNVKRCLSGENELPVENIVKEALEEVDLHPETVNLSISGPDVIVRFIDLPRMNKDQLDNALMFEAEKYIPFNVSEVVMDSAILGEAPEPGQMRVLLAAAKRKLVEARMDMMQKIGMTVRLIDTDPFALFNAFTRSHNVDQEESNVFIDLGHSHTNVLIAVGETPGFTRQIQIGGKDFTGDLWKELGVSPEKAEELDIPEKEPEKSALNTGSSSVLEDLIKEIQLSFGYFENRYNKGIKNIYCSGGVSYAQGVTGFLSDKMGLPVKQWDPMMGMEVADHLSRDDISSIASQLVVGIGLALRE